MHLKGTGCASWLLEGFLQQNFDQLLFQLNTLTHPQVKDECNTQLDQGMSSGVSNGCALHKNTPPGSSQANETKEHACIYHQELLS